jgi:hypothetical protein
MVLQKSVRTSSCSAGLFLVLLSSPCRRLIIRVDYCSRSTSEVFILLSTYCNIEGLCKGLNTGQVSIIAMLRKGRSR